ncbi:hypothetical protein Y1Q_0008359 [Alligator mississippiensis]|uniref:Uncharacterized protein n=1 Tax=Alligator mississippiensis TaxID=8496 RepID=A0A151N209_ALLMI|nr:hypothetical protein Y1Q_0008359 [Alligator mississippiensis]
MNEMGKQSGHSESANQLAPGDRTPSPPPSSSPCEAAEPWLTTASCLSPSAAMLGTRTGPRSPSALTIMRSTSTRRTVPSGPRSMS